MLALFTALMTTQLPPHEILVFKNNGFGVLRTVKREDTQFRLAFAVKEAVRLYAKRGSPHCMWPAPWDVAALIKKSALPRVYCLILERCSFPPQLEETTPSLRIFQEDYPAPDVSQEWWTPGMNVFPRDAVEPRALPIASVAPPVHMASVVVSPTVDPPPKRQRVEESPKNGAAKPPRGRGPITYKRQGPPHF